MQLGGDLISNIPTQAVKVEAITAAMNGLLVKGAASQTGLTATFQASPNVNSAVFEAVRLLVINSTASTGGAAGFGPGLSLYAETATDGTNQQQGMISTSWIDATNLTRKAKMSLSAYDTAARLGIEIEASGTEAKLGFYGVATITRAILATGAGATVDNVITALQNLGLVKQA